MRCRRERESHLLLQISSRWSHARRFSRAQASSFTHNLSHVMFSKHVLAFFLVPSLLDLSLWHWYIFSAQTGECVLFFLCQARIVTNCHEQPRVVASHNHAAGNCAFSFRRLSVAVYGSPVLNPLGMKAILVVIMTGGFLYASGSTKGRSPGFFVRFSHRARLLSRLLHSMQSRTQRYQGILSFETFRPAVLFPSLPLLLVKVSFRVSLP